MHALLKPKFSNPLAFLVISTLAAVLVAGCAGPRGERPAPKKDRPGPSAGPLGGNTTQETALFLATLDMDGDFRVTETDLDGAGPRLFVRLDTDKNGVVSGLEYQSFAETVLGNRFAAPGRIHFDRDLSGNISREEFEAALAALAKKFDTDGNGSIDWSELTVAATNRGSAMQPPEGGKPGERLPPHGNQRPGRGS